MNPKYDIAIAYRIYEFVSKVPAIYPRNKLELSRVGLLSLKASLEGIRAKLYIIIDFCPPEFAQMIKSIFPVDCEIIENNPRKFNYGTFAQQIDILTKQNDSEIVYLAEDDYVYVPGQFKELVYFIKDNKDVDFVSPYDHTDYYTSSFHNLGVNIKPYGTRYWKTGISTTLTFLTRKSILKETAPVFLTYSKNNYDASVWISLTKAHVFNLFTFIGTLFTEKWIWGMLWRAWRYNARQILFGRTFTLWVSLPSIATHLEKDTLGPLVDWQKYFKLFDKKNDEPARSSN